MNMTTSEEGNASFVRMPENRLLKKLRSGKTAVGTCAYSFSPDIVQLAGYCGMDFCRIDNEHAWRQDNALENMIRASYLSGTVAVSRVDRGNPYLVRKVLEIGSQAVLVPQVESRRETQEIIDAAKFPPVGTRGFGNLNASGRYGIVDSREWMDWSNSETMVGIMIETAKALDEIDGIMSLPGLDFVLIGTSDLSLSLGLSKPSSGDPKVLDCVRRITASARSHGKYVMIGVGKPWVENARKFIEMGCHMIELGHDYTVLRDVWSDLVKAVG